MAKRTFETAKLIEWGIHEWDACEHVVHFAELGMDKFEVRCEIVFRAPDDGRLWRFEFEINDGAGYNDIVGISYGENVRPELPSFDAVEVEPRQKVVTVYVPRKDVEPITVDLLVDMLGLVMEPTEIPGEEVLRHLTQEQLEEVGRWCGDVHLSASDNPVEVGAMPACLRDRLPDGHTYKTWRV